MLLYAAWTDIRFRRVPNLLIVIGFFSGFFLIAYLEGLFSLPNALLGALIGFAVLIPLYLMRWMGAGDVKLLALVGLYLGSEDIWIAIAYTAFSGGALAILYLLKPYVLHKGLKSKKETLPYAVAILFGTMITLGIR